MPSSLRRTNNAHKKPDLMRKRVILVFSVITLYSLLAGACTRAPDRPEEQSPPASAPVLMVQSGVEKDGRPTEAWIDAVRDRHDAAMVARLAEEENTLAPEERLWADVIARKRATWTGWIDSLSIPFRQVEPPDTVFILLGNAGGEDAFTFEEATIGFDLSKLHAIYGSATAPENDDRIDRFFAHEMTHVLHKAWQKKHGVAPASPLEYALWDCLVEGIGNYRSLSSKWVSKDGVLTSHAEATLAELQPVFVERLVALADAGDAEAAPLLEGLSSGPFAKKWGALTTALWLAQEARGEEARLQPWIEAGPWGILDLADKYLPEALGDTLAVIAKR